VNRARVRKDTHLSSLLLYPYLANERTRNFPKNVNCAKTRIIVGNENLKSERVLFTDHFK